MIKISTHLGSNVLITAFQGVREYSGVAMQILADSDRTFVISDYLKLETLPKPTFHNNTDEVEFLNLYFEQVTRKVEVCREIADHAIKISSLYDLTPIDSLHISSAIAANVDEFITLERQTKPMFKVPSVNIISLREDE